MELLEVLKEKTAISIAELAEAMELPPSTGTPDPSEILVRKVCDPR